MSLTKAEIQKRYREKHPERVKAQQKKWAESNKEHLTIKRREYISKNKEKVKQWSVDWKNNNPERVEELKTIRKLAQYGMTPNDYHELLVKQDGRCAICFNPEKLKNQKLAVDHCHETGKIRGLLCSGCNKGLGLLGDTLKSLEMAVEYLKSNG